jgi:hypothetical protein
MSAEPKAWDALYIDDLRTPPNDEWVIARSSSEAIGLMQKLGCPRKISFDHDLGGSDTAMVVAKWMVEADLDSSGQFIPVDFVFEIHSANPVGSANIRGLLECYLGSRVGH